MNLKLQLFADEAGAAEKCLPPDVYEKKEGKKPKAEEEKEKAEEKPDMARLRLLAESVASEKLSGRAKSLFEGESEEMKKIYPSFDLKKELENPVFARLMKLGADMKNAYEAANFEKLVSEAMKYAAEKTALYQCRAEERISENPVADRIAAAKKTDVNGLTRRDIMRIIEQAGKGAKITFR